MVISNLNVKCVIIDPTKTDPELIVDSNTVLSNAIAFQNFQSVPAEII